MSYTLGTGHSRQNSIDNRNWPAVISNSSCTPRLMDVQRVDEFYDHVGAHLRGVAKVLKPMIEINKIILDECRGSKSEDRSDRGRFMQSETKLSYYTPQRIKSSNSISSGDQRQLRACAEDSSGRKSTSDNSYNRSTNKSTYRPLFEASSSSILSISKKETVYSVESSSRLSSSTVKNSFQRPQGKSNSLQTDHATKNCSLCGIDVNKVKVLALVSCKHSFCYPCITHNELNSCPKCCKPLKRDTITNITSK